jgi:hypothetical protein
MKAIYPMVTDKNNRFVYSQELDNGTWNRVNLANVLPNSTPAPDGMSTGELVLEDTTTDQHYLYQTIQDSSGLTAGNEYIASIYGKFYNRPWIAIETTSGAKAWFNLQTGTTGSFTGSRATITNVGAGWYRCAVFYTASTSGPQNIQYNIADADNNLSYTGIATSGSYLWGAQFENGNVLGPYRVTTATGFTTGSMLDQMKFNLKNPADTDAAFRLTYSGSWNPGYSGNKGKGVSGTYADTNLRALVQLSPSSSHISMYVNSKNTQDNKVFIGHGNFTLFMQAFSGTMYGSLATTAYSEVSTTTTEAFYMVNRASTGTQKLIKNTNILLSDNKTGSLYTNDYNVLINAYTPTTYNNDCSYGFSTIGDGLTDYEAKALYWIVQKFQTTLGRQVY